MNKKRIFVLYYESPAGNSLLDAFTSHDDALKAQEEEIEERNSDPDCHLGKYCDEAIVIEGVDLHFDSDCF